MLAVLTLLLGCSKKEDQQQEDLMNAVPADEDSVAVEQPWGEVLNGLRMRVNAATALIDGTVIYQRGKSVPLEVEIENVSDEAIPLSRLFCITPFKVVDLKGERIGVQGYCISHIPPWQNASDVLQPSGKVHDVVYLERMRWKVPEGTD
jgi:hypothetical protein